MDYFGINSTDDLPKIREVLAEQIVEGTIINPTDFTSNYNQQEETTHEDEKPSLEVNEDGSLIDRDEE